MSLLRLQVKCHNVKCKKEHNGKEVIASYRGAVLHTEKEELRNTSKNWNLLESLCLSTI